MPRKSKKIHIKNPATASEIRKSLKISDADTNAALQALNAGEQNKDLFEKLIDKLVDLTNKDKIVWKIQLWISNCRLEGVEFAIDNPQDGKPVFYVKDQLGELSISSYKVRDLISAIYNQERRLHPAPTPDPSAKKHEEARKNEQKKACLEKCRKTIKKLNNLFPNK